MNILGGIWIAGTLLIFMVLFDYYERHREELRQGWWRLLGGNDE